MNNLVWLASYPKSGNTWFRVFLSNLLNPTDDSIGINNIKGIFFSSNRGMIDSICGVSVSDHTEDEVEDLQRETFIHLSKNSKKPLYLKTHDSFRETTSGQRFFAEGITTATLYFVRNPLDVAVSYAYHGNRPVSDLVERLSDKNGVLASLPLGISSQVKQPLGSWSDHVNGWLNAPPDMNVLVTRYEDMVLEPVTTFTKAIRFLGLDVTAEAIKNALKRSEFNSLQNQERKKGFVEKNPTSDVFFRKGIIGDWRNELTQKDVEKIIEDHGDLMAKLGYLDDANSPIIF